MLGKTPLNRMLQLSIASTVVAICVAAPGAAHADVTLQNDGFQSGGAAGFMGGFGPGDIGASRFVAPGPSRQLLKLQLIFGPDSAAVPMTVKVYDDSAGTDAPGAELYSMDFQLTGSTSALIEIDLTADNVIV